MKWYRNLKLAPKLINGFLAVAIVAGADGAAVMIAAQHFSGMTAILVFAGLSLAGLLIAFFTGLVIARLISKPINMMVETAEKIAEGDMNASCSITAKGEIGQLDGAFHKMVVAFRAMVDDLKTSLSAAGAGNLSERADASRHSGDFRAVVEGFNGMLDILSAPLNEFKSAVQRINGNDFSQEVSGRYEGIFAEMAEYFNSAMHQMQGVAAAFGDTARGDFANLPNYEKLGRRSENDHLLPSAIKMMRSINDLVDESNRLSAAIKEGNLDFRGDETKFEGRYREAIAGMNGIMEALSLPMNEVMAVLGAMERHDLSAEMTGEYKGAFKALAHTINSVLNTLNQILGDISAAAEQVAFGTQQVSAGSQALSQGATEQASATEQLTASLSEIANQTRQNAMNANQASDLAVTAKQDAVAGDVRMKELQQAMGEINEASASISKIIKVIDDIAFQTNLLALNAAVEAARAGQHGRGFAVVAEEVRNLAARSAGAAKETTEMIEESIKKVKSGTKIANETASALNRIVGGVEKAAGLVGGIAKASGDQASAVAQVNSGIEQVSQVTQTNSATAEQSAAASEELSSQAELLKDMVGKFNLRTSVHERSANAAPKADRRTQLVSARAQQFSAKPKIALNDSDFGKY